jgi:CheY-like chemotaxis protein
MTTIDFAPWRIGHSRPKASTSWQRWPDGAAAPEVVAATKPDLVLIDIRMPGIDGLEVARRLAAADAPPVILISTIDVVDGCRLADGIAVGYLPKDELSLDAITGLLPSP